MNHSLLRFLAGFAIILILAFSSNPPNGRTGAPGDGLCSDCHSAGAQNGNVMITGMPAVVNPGQTYTLTVTSNTTTSSVLAGFQMVGLHDDGDINAGSMSNASAGSTITVVGSGRSYHEHNPAAGYGGGTSVSWTVDWTAPTSGPDGDITFYAASVLANGNSNSGGDGVVTTNVSGSFMGLDPLSVSISSSSPVSCPGGADGTATAAATGGTPPYTYLWSSGETDPIATMLSEGMQSVTVTDDNSMTATASVNIGAPTAISPNAAVDNNITCNGDNDGQASSNPAGGTPPYSFMWSDGQTSGTATGLTPGPHAVTITDVNGCEEMETVTITEPDLLIVDLITQTNISCFGFNDGSATVQGMGGTMLYTYTWSTGQVGATATNLTPGLHTVTLTDANSCADLLEIIITEPDELIISPVTQENVSCFNGTDGSATVSAVGGTGTYSYLWSDGQTGPTANNLTANVYTCTVSDANGCMDIEVINISQPLEIDIVLDITDESGPGANDGSITATVTGGTGPYSLTWSNGGSGTTISDLMPGDYTLTVLDANDCIMQATGTVMGSGCDLTIELTVVQDLNCPGDNNGILTVQANNEISSISWSTGATTDTIMNLSGGMYSVTVTDSANCEVMSSISLNGMDTEAPGYILDTLCLFLGTDGTATLDSMTFYENLEDNCDPDPEAIFTNLTVSCTDQGISSMDYSLQDASGNIAPVTLYLIIIDTISPSITCPADITVNTCDVIDYAFPSATDNCEIDTIELVGGIGSGNVFPVGTTIETYRVLDGNGNLATCSFSITVISDLDVSVLTTNTSCFNSNDGTAVINGIGGTAPYTFMLSTSDNPLSLSQGIYSVTITDDANCVALDTFVIGGPSPIELDSILVMHATAGNFDGSIEIDVIGGTPPYSYLWTRDTTAYSVEEDLFNLFSGFYSLKITDANDCIASFDSILVDEMVANNNQDVSDPHFEIFEHDETIFVTAINYLQAYTFKVFDLQGKVIAQVEDNYLQSALSLRDQPKGFYLVVISDENGLHKTQKIVIR